MNTIDNEVTEVGDRLRNVVTKSELSGFMNIFGEPEFRREYVLWDGQPFESALAYAAIYGKAEKTLYVIDNYIGVKTLALLKNSKEDVQIILFSDNVGRGLHSTEFSDFCKQYPDCKIELKQTGKKYHGKDKKTRYYYYCKNTVNATGHKCTFRVNIEQTEMNRMVTVIISAMVNKPVFVNVMSEKF